MNCDELRDSYEMYALGLAEDPERSEISEHLARGCSQCSEEMRKALELVNMMSVVPPEITPPKALKRRILSSVGAEPVRTSNWLAWAAAVAALLVIGLWQWQDRRRAASEMAALRMELHHRGVALEATQREADRLRGVMQFLRTPETREVRFGAAEQSPPRGRVLVNPRHGVMMIAENLPPLQKDRTYELWLVPQGGAPKPAGIFVPLGGGLAVHLFEGPFDAKTTVAVAVSVEPAGGSPAPTTKPILVVGL